MGVTGTVGGSSEHPDEPDRPTGPPGRFADDLVGLDPADPEAKAFADHLDRMERVHPNYTVEGYLGQVNEFADSANRLGGHHRLTAGIVATLILLGVLVAAWDALVFIVGAVFG
ncbi:hypothetical protein V5P93_005923 [Actinokineospora auranticolor]|uniref:Uncharacterized protein n=1 Tax=Actinokineospora auranticolor TaxID=155976 RepID=A0A2S6GHI9_9PSEU|nr:hypothetical protein [Actinokineospora auranticolor]PPK64687.1 hypothetical protein CLV40_11877 [Actinokineospora auranticolor]